MDNLLISFATSDGRKTFSSADDAKRFLGKGFPLMEDRLYVLGNTTALFEPVCLFMARPEETEFCSLLMLAEHIASAHPQTCVALLPASEHLALYCRHVAAEGIFSTTAIPYTFNEQGEASLEGEDE